MTDPLHELIDLLAETPKQMKALIAGQQDSANASTIGAVLADALAEERRVRAHVIKIVHENTPYLRQRDAGVTTEEAAQSLDALAEAFGRERGETLTLLMNLSMRDWEREGIHEQHGEQSVEDLIERLVEHDRAMLDRLNQLRKA